MDKMKDQNVISAEVIQNFFKEDYGPDAFLERLHQVIVDYVRVAGNFSGQADLATIAENVDFLGNIYDVVKAASRE